MLPGAGSGRLHEAALATGVLAGLAVGSLAARWARAGVGAAGNEASPSARVSWTVGAGLLALPALIFALGGARASDVSGESVSQVPQAQVARGESPSPAMSIWQEGRTLQMIGLYEDAIASYTEALGRDPRFAEAYRSRASAYLDAGDPQKATVDLGIAIYLDPQRFEFFRDRAFAFWQLGDSDKAMADLNSVIALDTQNALGYYNRGLLYGMNGEMDASIADFDEAIRLDPWSTESFYNRGVSYARKGDLDRALADFGQVIERQPDHVGALMNRALAYKIKGDFPAAERDLENALNVTWDPESASAIREAMRELNLSGA